MPKLPQSYYLGDDVESIARSLLGKFLFTRIDSEITGGIITETEAYKGISDKASHAFGGKRTKRTEVMYNQGGVSYVYLCYGIHNLLNVVTAGVNTPHAVLIRGIYPLTGVNLMLNRTGKSKIDYNLSNGPGKLSRALGINANMNNVSYQSDNLWIEDKGIIVKTQDIKTGPRIGVGYAAEDASLPYRYVLIYQNYLASILSDKKSKEYP